MKSREKAVALQYKESRDHAPRVTAKGVGLIAEKIKETARQHGVPIRRDDTLVELLAQIDIDREIPSELYGAVAEILSWIYRADKNLNKEPVG